MPTRPRPPISPTSFPPTHNKQALQDAMSKMLAVSTAPQEDPLSPPPAGAQPFLANAGIGNRPTLLTVSLVYDEGGEASAFHVALIPRSTGDSCGGGAENSGGQASVAARNSTEYDAGAPGFSVGKGSSGSITGGGVIVSCSSTSSQEGCDGKMGAVVKEEDNARGVAGKRGPESTWEPGGQKKRQKRRAAEA